jgi:hypothetical protein
MFDFFSPRTLIAKNISTKKYYERISELEIDNGNENMEEEKQINDNKTPKATEVQVRVQ